MPARKTPAAKRAPKKLGIEMSAESKGEVLFDRVAAILEQARANVVRAVNSNMVLAYWLIGREIVQEVQGGGKRAAYGKQVVDSLSRRLGDRYGQGFSLANLKNFRQFYQIYQSRLEAIRHPVGSEFIQSESFPAISCPPDAELAASSGKSYPLGSELITGFSSQLSWSHYRALMRVGNVDAREFYEREAVAGGWNKRTLERQKKSETVAKYSVLKDRKQIFASKYMLYLPTEQQLREEIERERRLIEDKRNEQAFRR